MLYNGKGGKKDLNEARHYLKLAAENGYRDAQYHYAVMLQNREGGKQDLKESRKYFKLAAEQGH